jgi:hypothetical protein
MRNKTLNPHAGSFVPGTNGVLPVAAPAAGGGGVWSTNSDNTNNNAVAAAAAGLMAMFPPLQTSVNMFELPPRPANSGNSAIAGPTAAGSAMQQPFTASTVMFTNPSMNAPQPQQLLSPSAMHRALMQLRLAVVNRCSLSSMPFPNAHLYFEHLMYTAYKTASTNAATCITGTHHFGQSSGSLKPFWRFFSTDQVASLAHALVAAEKSSSAQQQSATAPTQGGSSLETVLSSQAPRPTSAFTDEELDILKGIYYRNAHSVFPSTLRKQLIAATASLFADPECGNLPPSYSGGITASAMDDSENFIVDVFWVTFRTVFLPSPDECGLQALTAAVQFVAQLRTHLFQTTTAASRNVLGLLLPFMTLSRYYVVLQRGAAGGDTGPSSVLLFSQYFMSMMSSFLTSSPFDAVETIHERLCGGSWQQSTKSQVSGPSLPAVGGAASGTNAAAQPPSSDFVKEWTLLFSHTTNETSAQVRGVLDESAANSSILPPVRWLHNSNSPSTLLEIALGIDNFGSHGVANSQQRSSSTASTTPPQIKASAVHAGSSDVNATQSYIIDALNTSTDQSNEVQFPAPVIDSAFMDHVLQTSSWCSDDEMVRFATLTLANSDLISLSRLSQLFSGLRQAYHSETGGTFEALMDILAQYKTPTISANGNHNHTTTGGVPPGVQEVIEFLMFVIKPGNPTHVQALEDASEMIDQRLEEQLAPTRTSAVAAAQASPPRLSGSAEMRTGTPSILALASPQRGLLLDDTAPLWQDDSIAEMSVGDDAVVRNASVSSAFRASGSIW